MIFEWRCTATSRSWSNCPLIELCLLMDSPRSHHLGLSLGASKVPEVEDLSSAEELESDLPLE